MMQPGLRCMELGLRAGRSPQLVRAGNSGCNLPGKPGCAVVRCAWYREMSGRQATNFTKFSQTDLPISCAIHGRLSMARGRILAEWGSVAEVPFRKRERDTGDVVPLSSLHAGKVLEVDPQDELDRSRAALLTRHLAAGLAVAGAGSAVEVGLVKSIEEFAPEFQV